MITNYTTYSKKQCHCKDSNFQLKILYLTKRFSVFMESEDSSLQSHNSQFVFDVLLQILNCAQGENCGSSTKKSTFAQITAITTWMLSISSHTLYVRLLFFFVLPPSVPASPTCLLDSGSVTWLLTKREKCDYCPQNHFPILFDLVNLDVLTPQCV